MSLSDRASSRLYKSVDVVRRGIDLVYRDSVAKIAAFLLPSRVMRMGKYFSLWERHGFHVMPTHYYSPIPEASTLTPQVLEKKSMLYGIDMRSEQQVELLHILASEFHEVFLQFSEEPLSIPHRYHKRNGYFSPVDASVLYGFIRHFKPSRIVEVGSGYSTYIAAQAVTENRRDGVSTTLTAIEPYPNSVIAAGFEGLDKLHSIGLQSVPTEIFDKLTGNDILFIDSSHVLKTGSDVQKLYLDIIPRLKPGVIIHVHDVFLPYEYPSDWLLERHIFWNEQYLLQALLCGNKGFEVLLGNHFMLRDFPEVAQAVWGVLADPNGQEPIGLVRPNSFWFRRVV